ncbi:hypothetical protein B0H12DRAFT_1271765, partial [Mycena haematopus]
CTEGLDARRLCGDHQLGTPVLNAFGWKSGLNLPDDSAEFQEEWNLHPIRGTSDQSPADIRFLGQVTDGVYQDDPLDGIHPDAINRYYAVEGHRLRRSRNQTGAGTSVDEGDDEEDDNVQPSEEEQLENQIEGDLAHNIRHQPVKVAKHRSPFKNAEFEKYFMSQLEDLLAEPGILPEEYGVREEEWEGDDYLEIEVFRPGTKGKELSIILPRDIWFPRAVRWAQGLDLLSRVLEELGEDSGSNTESDSD